MRRKLLTALILCLLAGIQSPVLAQEKDDKEKPKGPTIDEQTGKRLNEAIEFLNNEQYSEAKAVIGKLNLEKLSPYERSRVEQILASIAHAQENFDAARTHLNNALAAGGLNEQEVATVRYQIAQLFMAQEKWKEGAASLEEWFKTATPNSAAYYLLAVAYYQLEDFKKALPPAKKAVELTEKPQETWVQLLLAIYLQQEQFAAAIPLLRQLIALAPEKKVYWMQLSSVYGQLENYEQSVVYLQLAYNAGHLTEDSELRRLSDLLMFVDIPYRAGQVLEKAIEEKKIKVDSKAYEKLANAWIAAREYEKSISPLRQAAQMSGNGDLFVRLGEVQVQRDKWPEAAEAIKLGLDKGGLKDTANAQLLMGIALYNQDKFSDARSYLQKASGSTKHAQTAKGYLQAIEAELSTQ